MVKTKKAYLRTIEAMLAVVLTFAFILYFMPGQKASETGVGDILANLETNDEFRSAAANISGCVYNTESTNLTLILSTSMPQAANYALCPSGEKPVLPRKKVNVDSLFLTGNVTDYEERILRLYYWN